MQLSDNTRGALIMVLCVGAFSVNDAFTKAFMLEVPQFQGLFLRGVLHIILVYTVLVRIVGPVRFDLDPRDLKLVAVRSLAETGAAFTFVAALNYMALANASAIMQTAPLTITLASTLLFKEPLGWRRILAIVCGFIGVLFIVKPGGDAFNVYSILAVAAMGFVSIRDLTVRAMSRTVPNATVTLGAVLSVTVAMGLASLTIEWQPVSPRAAADIVISGVAVMIGYVLSIYAMRTGDVSFTQTFRYTQLIWALLLGLVLFGEWPDKWALLGGGIIASAGIYTVLREAKLRRRLRRASQQAG